MLYLSLLEDGWIDNANDNQAGDDQSESDESDEKHAASAGGKFTPYDPVLVFNISMGTVSLHYFPAMFADIPGSQSTFFLRQVRPRLQFLRKSLPMVFQPGVDGMYRLDWLVYSLLARKL